MKGLDAYASENDERMLDLLSESKRRSGGHWFVWKIFPTLKFYLFIIYNTELHIRKSIKL